MPTKRYDHDELEFMRSVGLDRDRLEELMDMEPAEPVSQESLQRIRTMTYRKLGIMSDDAESVESRQPAASWWRRNLPAAVALLLVLGFGIAARLPSTQAAIEKLLYLVPGFGITETSGQTLVLAGPVQVEGKRGHLTVTALVSNGENTEVRFHIDGVVSTKPDPSTMDQSPLEAALVLEDGTRFDHSSAQFSAGEKIIGSLWFPALPDETESVRLELSSIHGMTEPFEAQLTVVDIASADLTKATIGGWSEYRNGVILGAPYWAIENERIVLTLDSILEEKGARVDRILESLTLTDDLGNSYPLIVEESELTYNMGKSNQAVFRGPVDEQASSLRLSIEAIQILEKGEARLQIPLDKLRLNSPVEINEKIQVGRWPVIVRSVTRIENQQSDDRFALDLDLGPVNDKIFLQYLHVGPYRARGGGSFQIEEDELLSQGSNFEVFYEARGRYLDLRFDLPMIGVYGPWNIEIPLNR